MTTMRVIMRIPTPWMRSVRMETGRPPRVV